MQSVISNELRLNVTTQASHASQERMGVRWCTEGDNLYAS
jgi:hypothetical protein